MIIVHFRVLNDDEQQKIDMLYSSLQTCLAKHIAAADIQHIGSTAIVGALTKGDLDIVARVDQSDFTGARDHLDTSFAINKGSPRTDQFASYAFIEDNIDCGIQLVVRGSEHDKFHLFRDRLLSDNVLQERYNALKMSMSGQRMSDYRERKSAFVAEITSLRGLPA